MPDNIAPLLTEAEADADAVEIDEHGQEIGGEQASALVVAAGPPSAALAVPEASGGLARPITTETRHAPRFQFILGALIALGLSAVVLVLAVVHSGRDAVAPRWSVWHPTSGGYAGAAQIASWVGSKYRLPSGRQMVTVSGGQPQFQGIPATLALSTGTTPTSSVLIVTGASVLYRMCGAKANCQISGTPTAQRMLLVRREALELALYTFRYLGADDVLVELPPGYARVRQSNGAIKTQLRHNATFFTAQQLSPQITRPLGATLTPQTPGVDSVAQSPDLPTVEQLTSPAFVNFSFKQSSQDGNLYLVLQPLVVS
jgi:hypothetical protein